MSNDKPFWKPWRSPWLEVMVEDSIDYLQAAVPAWLVAETEVFTAGVVEGEVFTAGMVEGEVFTPGAVAGEVL